MPQAPKTPTRFRRPREKQDPEIGKRLKQACHIKSIRDHERSLYELEIRHEEMQDAEWGYDTILRKVESLRREKQQLYADIEAKKSELQNMSTVNGHLKMDLIKHQPACQLADSQIVELYDKLLANLQSWVDAQFQRFYESAKTETDGQSPQGHIFHHGSIPEYVAFLKAYPDFGAEYLVISQVYLQLYEHLLKDDGMLFVMHPQERYFVGVVEDGLKRLTTPRDASDIEYLKSEMLKGLTASQQFWQRRCLWMTTKGVAILNYIEIILPKVPDADAHERKRTFERHILDPAFDLALAMHSSATSYGFSELVTKESQFRQRTMKNYDRDSSDMIDIMTRRRLRHQEKYAGESDSIGATRVLLLAPGLSRLSGEGSPRRLSNDLVCVEIQCKQYTRYRKLEPKPEIVPETSSNTKTMDDQPKQRKTFTAKVVRSSEEPEANGENAKESADIIEAQTSSICLIKNGHDSPAIISDDDSTAPKPVLRDAKRKRYDLT
ncbi:MAG: hypothetical protein Q9180_007355, partial [Flavoplaca navasiana]